MLDVIMLLFGLTVCCPPNKDCFVDTVAAEVDSLKHPKPVFLHFQMLQLRLMVLRLSMGPMFVIYLMALPLKYTLIFEMILINFVMNQIRLLIIPVNHAGDSLVQGLAKEN